MSRPHRLPGLSHVLSLLAFLGLLLSPAPGSPWPMPATAARELRVAFLSGSSAERLAVLEVAQRWSHYAPVTFALVSDPAEAHLRVSLSPKQPSFSALGQEAASIASPKPTMNLSLPRDLTQGEREQLILATFGKALGISEPDIGKDGRPSSQDLETLANLYPAAGEANEDGDGGTRGFPLMGPGGENTSPEPPPKEGKDRGILVDVYYATDRAPTATPTKPHRAHLADRSPGGALHYGIAHVSLPPNHTIGVVERPKWYKLEFWEDAKKHVVVKDPLSPLGPVEYFEQLTQASSEKGINEGLLFVHGFNTTFHGALLRTAQVTCDLDFGGIALTYSWPSHGDLDKYTPDLGNAQWAYPHLADYLVDLQEKAGLDRLHILAHSMGSLVTCRAIERAHLADRGLKLGHVILAAPDLDTDLFREQLLAPLHATAESLTLYTSSKDKALMASSAIQDNSRLGLSRDLESRVFPDMDTVDASQIDTSLIGHTVYGDHKLVVEDIMNVVVSSLPPTQRDLLPGTVGEWLFPGGPGTTATTEEKDQGNWFTRLLGR
ncbi:MAG: alpha/beta hydrolase [Verrucomicrobiota bacterium]